MNNLQLNLKNFTRLQGLDTRREVIKLTKIAKLDIHSYVNAMAEDSIADLKYSEKGIIISVNQNVNRELLSNKFRKTWINGF